MKTKYEDQLGIPTVETSNVDSRTLVTLSHFHFYFHPIGKLTLTRVTGMRE